MCKFLLKWNTGKACRFAHTKEELRKFSDPIHISAKKWFSNAEMENPLQSQYVNKYYQDDDEDYEDDHTEV